MIGKKASGSAIRVFAGANTKRMTDLFVYGSGFGTIERGVIVSRQRVGHPGESMFMRMSPDDAERMAAQLTEAAEDVRRLHRHRDEL